MDAILDFLYSCDANGEASVETCRQIYDLIKDFETKEKFGYPGRKDCATFDDIKELVRDCIDSCCEMTWY